MVHCICSPSKIFRVAKSLLYGSLPLLQNPRCKSEKVCSTSCRNKGTRPLPYSWETSPLPANGTPWLAPTRLGAPQASLFRVQKRRPFKILTTRQQLSISVRHNVASLRGRQHVRLGRQETKQAGLPKDLYCMRYASLPVASVPVPCRDAPSGLLLCDADSRDSSLPKEKDSMPTRRR